MALSDAFRLELLAYCRIEPDSEDAMLVDGMYADAVSMLEDGGVIEPPEGTPRRAKYDLIIMALVLDSYDNRGATTASTIQENISFRRRLNQLKHTEPPPDLGSGSAAQ